MSTEKKEKEIRRLNNFLDLEDDPHPDKNGVLLSDEIKFYVERSKLIDPFDTTNLKPAAYELTVGDEAMIGGKYILLGESTDENQVIIPPFEVAVVKTRETLNLPRFLIGRWNIRVAWAYRGLVWVGGPQVDPGYLGNLFCPLYNLSNKTVRVKKGSPIAVMDFVKTTPFEMQKGNEKWERYGRPPKRVIIDDYEIDDFRSATYEETKRMQSDLKEVQSKINTFSGLVFVVLAILMSAVALPYFGYKPLSTASQTSQYDLHILYITVFSLILSILAVFLGFFASMSSLSEKLSRRTQNLAILGFLGVILTGIIFLILSAFHAVEKVHLIPIYPWLIS